MVKGEPKLDVYQAPTYVSRAGAKLAFALERFCLNVNNLVCLDVGASTGGFTDCLLQHHAQLVYSVDVGTNQLAYKLRVDKRVYVKEQYNFRYANYADFKLLFSFVCIDVSFISLNLIFSALPVLLAPSASIVALIKPQFEAERT